MIVAIDGPAAAGKGTLAKALAARLGFALLDTGLLYRAVGMKVLAAGGDPADPAAAVPRARDLVAADLAAPGLRSEAAADAASKVAAIPEVRAALLDFQRDFARRPPNGAPGAVLDGRDIGTHVCPEAEIKLFVTASPEVRARRRVAELEGRGETADPARVLADVRARDARDSGRAAAPLRPAEDARVIDTGTMTPEEVLTWALDYITNRTRSGPVANQG